MSQFKSYLKYIISLVIAGVLLWYVFRDFELESLFNKLREVDYRWVGLAVIIFLVSHTLRAYRWNTMLKPLDFRQLTTFRTLLAVMIGYFANLIVPRMGEVSRCGVLKKTDQVPITTSLGTVVAERVVDLACLLTAVIALFVIEFDRVSDFMLSFFQDKMDKVGQNVFALYILTAIAFAALLIFFLLGRIIKKKLKHNALYAKIRTFIREMLIGLTSISRIENKGGFWLATLLMWVSYFMMSYVVFFSLPETAGLGWRAGLAVLVMGSLGMAAPVQGGFGTFHALVSGILLLYGVSEQEGVLFATLIHTMQTVCFILFGGISFFLASIIPTKASRHTVQESIKS